MTGMTASEETWAASGPSTLSLPRVRPQTDAQRAHTDKVRNLNQVVEKHAAKGPGKQIRMAKSLPPLRGES